MLRGVGLFGVIAFFSGSLRAAPACDTYESDILGGAVRYCVQRSRPDIEPVKGEPVVYFFHGIRGSSETWAHNGYAEALDVLAKEEHFPAFTVITFDTSDISFFSDREDIHDGPEAYETWFIREFMPYMERAYRVCSERSCRGTAGMSMGGFGALKTALKYHELFSFVGINSAALAPFNLWNDVMDWTAYFDRHPIGYWKGMFLLQEVRNIFPTREIYARNDPFELLEGIKDQKDFPKLYLDVGGKDYFGFQEGYFRLTKMLDDRHWAYQSYFDPNGGHDIFGDRRWWLLRFIRDQIPAKF